VGFLLTKKKKMIDSQIYNILLPIKSKTIAKIKKNIKEDKKKLNIIKAAVPKLNVICTFERTFSTCLGYSLQEVAAKCGKNVINTDTKNRKISDIDLRTEFGEGQMKLNKNTQTGTHVKDSIKKLIDTTKKNGTKPFFVTALGKSYEYDKDNILYLGGNSFWSKIDLNYSDVYDTIIKVIQETYYDVESTIIPTL
jgi:hypothetical protein